MRFGRAPCLIAGPSLRRYLLLKKGCAEWWLLQGPAHHVHHFVDGEWLLDRQHRAEQGSVAQQVQALGLASAGHCDDPNTWTMREKLYDGLNAILPRHMQIGNDQIAAVIAPETDCFIPILGQHDFVAGSVEESTESSSNTRIVINDQNSVPSLRNHMNPQPARTELPIGGASRTGSGGVSLGLVGALSMELSDVRVGGCWRERRKL
jgi:hypothetical protein